LSISNNRVILDTEYTNLLRYSALIDNYPDLKKIINQKSNITLSDLDKLQEVTKKTLQYDIQNFISAIKGEWQAIKNGDNLEFYDNFEDSEEYSSCQVCNNSHCRYLYNIKNKVTGEIIIVGSTCIYKYDIEVGLSGETKSEYLKRQDSTQKKLFNTAKFNMRYPNAINNVKSWYSDYKDLIFKLPTELDKRFISCYGRANKIIEQVQKNSVTKNAEINFQAILNEYKAIKIDIDKYIKNNINNRFAMTAKVSSWLIQREKIKLHQQIAETGQVGSDTYPYIHEINFVKQFIEDYIKVFKNIKVEKIICDFERNYLIFTYNKKSTLLRLSANMETFFDEFKGIIYEGIKIIDQYKFIELCSIETDENTVNYFVNELDYLMSKTHFEIAKYYPEHNKIFIRNKQKNIYLEMNLRSFLNGYLRIVLFYEGTRNLNDDLTPIIKPRLNDLQKFKNWNSYENYKELTDKLETTVKTTQYHNV